MPEQIAELSATITADTSKFERALAGARDALGRFSKSGADAAKGVDATTAANERAAKSANAMHSAFSGLGGVAGALSFGVALKGFKSLTDSASDLNESLGKSQVVFKENANAVEQWADRSAKAMGQSKQEALEAAGTFGNLFSSLGIGGKSAAQMSTKIVELAGDLASFNNVKPEEAILALRSAMTGEAEPMKRFGVNMNENTLKAQALKMGLIATAKEGLTPATKAAAAYQLILDQTKNAQGDFARTSGGLANQQRIVEAEFKNASAELGKNLLPVMLSATHTASDLIGKFNELPNATKQMGLEFAALVAGAGPLTRVISGMASLTTGIYGVVAAAGAGGLVAVAGTVGILAASLATAAGAAYDLYIWLDKVNEENAAKEKYNALPEKYKRSSELRENIAQFTHESDALLQYQNSLPYIQRSAKAGMGYGYEGLNEQQVGALKRAFEHTGIGPQATNKQLEDARVKLAGFIGNLEVRAKKLEGETFDAMRDKKTGLIAPRPTLQGAAPVKFTPQAPAGPTEADLKRKQDEWKRHQSALLVATQKTQDAIYARTHTEFDVRRRMADREAQSKRGDGQNELLVEKWLAGEKNKIRVDEDNDRKKRIKDHHDQVLQANNSEASASISRLENLREAGVIDLAEEKSRLLKKLDLTKIDDETRRSILESGTEGRVALLRKVDAVQKEIDDKELERFVNISKLRKEHAQYIRVGMMGGFFTPDDLKRKPTDAEKASASLTERLRKGVADGRGAFSKADGHIDREVEAMAQYDIDVEKVRKGVIKLTAEQKRLIAESMRWSAAKDQLEAYNRKMEQVKGQARGILKDAFAGALDGSEGFFKSIRTSFKKLLVNMAAEWAASEVVKAVFGLAGKRIGGLGPDAKAARNDMVIGATAIGAAAAALSGAAASVAASGAALQAGSFAGLGASGAGVGAAAGAAGAAKSGGLMGAGLSKTLGYVGVGLAADQILFKGAISKTIGKTLGKVGKIFGFAKGGNPPLDRPSIVGEDGPELFWPKGAGTVHSNKDSRSLLSGMGAGGGVNFNGPVTISSQADVDRIQSVRRAKAEQAARLL